MGAVLELENRSIRDIYLFILNITTVVILETLITDVFITPIDAAITSTLPIFLIGCTIGYSLFWLVEFVVWRSILLEKTKRTKYEQRVIFFSRYTVLGGLLYFLFASIDIIYVIIVCILYFGTTWFSNKGRSKDSSKEHDAKSVTNIEMYEIASNGLIFVLTFCMGYFVGRLIGGEFDNADIGANIGLVLGFVVGCVVLIVSVRKQKQRRDSEQQLIEEKGITY